MLPWGIPEWDSRKRWGEQGHSANASLTLDPLPSPIYCPSRLHTPVPSQGRPQQTVLFKYKGHLRGAVQGACAHLPPSNGTSQGEPGGRPCQPLPVLFHGPPSTCPIVGEAFNQSLQLDMETKAQKGQVAFLGSHSKLVPPPHTHTQRSLPGQ